MATTATEERIDASETLICTICGAMSENQPEIIGKTNGL